MFQNITYYTIKHDLTSLKKNHSDFAEVRNKKEAWSVNLFFCLTVLLLALSILVTEMAMAQCK